MEMHIPAAVLAALAALAAADQNFALVDGDGSCVSGWETPEGGAVWIDGSVVSGGNVPVKYLNRGSSIPVEGWIDWYLGSRPVGRGDGWTVVFLRSDGEVYACWRN